MKNIKLPRYKNLPGRVLARLLNGQRLTHRSFQDETSSYRLSHFIWVLNGYGWPIQSIEKTGLTSDPVGRRAIYSEYFIDPVELISLKKELGEKLNRFVELVDRFEKGASHG